jgi:hypothetical protein
VKVGQDESILKKNGAIFYADDGLLSGNDATEVQRALEILADGFSRVGLKMNATKTKAMIMTGGQISLPLSKLAYSQKITGVGVSQREHGLQRIKCNLCGEAITRRNMIDHQQRKKCQIATNNWQPTNQAETEMQEPEPEIENKPWENAPPREYHFSMPKDMWTECPATDCPFKSRSRQKMRHHFWSRHPQATVIIGEEGHTPLPQCPKCGLFQQNVGNNHQNSLDCKKATTIRENRESAPIQQSAEKVAFSVGDNLIENVKEFKYLGRILQSNDKDMAAVTNNLQRARTKWGQIGRILSRKGANPRSMATFYKAIVQSVLLYGSESWVPGTYDENACQP